jgi:hypothetical protein
LPTERVQQNTQSLVYDRSIDEHDDDEEWSSDKEFVNSELNSTMTCVNVNNINTSDHFNLTSPQTETLSVFTNEKYNLKDLFSLPLDQLSKEQLLQRLIIAEKRSCTHIHIHIHIRIQIHIQIQIQTCHLFAHYLTLFLSQILFSFNLHSLKNF